VTRWYRERAAWTFIGARYLPWLAAFSLAWEIAQLPLYTLWREADPGYIAFAVAHCTLGDVIIGGGALVLALTLGRQGGLAHWRRSRIAIVTALLGASYTIFSEWMNTTVLGSWAYAESMPTIQLGAFELGLAPLAQWLVLPPLALYLADLDLNQPRRRQSR
jgi:hypothetical protein